MEFFKQLNRFTQISLIAAITLLLYSVICRLVGFYFFWESSGIGWVLILVSVMAWLIGRIKQNSAQSKKSIAEKIGIGVVIFVFFIQTLVVTIISQSDAYSAAKANLIDNTLLKEEIGTVTGFGLMPKGGVQMSSSKEGKSGYAEINLVVKGTQKYKDVKVYLAKYPDQADWVVLEIE